MKKIIKDLPIEAYHYEEWYKDFISATGVKKANDSLKAFKYYIDTVDERERVIHFDFGNAFELALLDRAAFQSKVAVFEDLKLYNKIGAERPELKSIRASKEFKTTKAEFMLQAIESGKYIINDYGDHSLETIQKMLISCHADPTIKAILEKVEYQYSFFWECPETGLNLKTRPDVAIINKNNLIDIKTTEDASPKAVARDIAKFGYTTQACMQIDGVVQSGCMPHVDNYFWLFVEKKAPFDAVLYEFSKEDREMKTAAYKRTLSKIARAIKENEYPGYRGNSGNEYGILTAKIY